MVYETRMEKVYWVETTYGGSQGGHCGYQWVADINVSGTVHYGRILNKAGIEPTKEDMEKACREAIETHKVYLRQLAEEKARHKKVADKELQLNMLAHSLRVVGE